MTPLPFIAESSQTTPKMGQGFAKGSVAKADFLALMQSLRSIGEINPVATDTQPPHSDDASSHTQGESEHDVTASDEVEPISLPADADTEAVKADPFVNVADGNLMLPQPGKTLQDMPGSTAIEIKTGIAESMPVAGGQSDPTGIVSQSDELVDGTVHRPATPQDHTIHQTETQPTNILPKTNHVAADVDPQTAPLRKEEITIRSADVTRSANAAMPSNSPSDSSVKPAAPAALEGAIRSQPSLLPTQTEQPMQSANRPVTEALQPIVQRDVIHHSIIAAERVYGMDRQGADRPHIQMTAHTDPVLNIRSADLDQAVPPPPLRQDKPAEMIAATLSDKITPPAPGPRAEISDQKRIVPAPSLADKPHPGHNLVAPEPDRNPVSPVLIRDEPTGVPLENTLSAKAADTARALPVRDGLPLVLAQATPPTPRINEAAMVTSEVPERMPMLQGQEQTAKQITDIRVQHVLPPTVAQHMTAYSISQTLTARQKQDSAAMALTADRVPENMAGYSIPSDGRATQAISVTPTSPVIPAQPVLQQTVQLILKGPHAPAELRLDPPELGRISVILSTQDNHVHVTVMTDRPETTDFFRRHADQLQQDLKSAGFTSINLSFAERQDSDGQTRLQTQVTDPDERVQQTPSSDTSSEQGPPPPSSGFDRKV